MNTFIAKYLPLLLAIILGSGCASSYRLGMIESVKPKYADMIIGNDQREINAEFQRSNVSTATGGGLIFALVDAAIDHSRAEDASAGAANIRNQLLDVDFTQELSASLQSALDLSPINFSESQLISLTSHKDVSSILSQSYDSSVMVITPYYAMTNEFMTLLVKLDVSLYTKNPESINAIAATGREGKKTKNVIYRNEIGATYVASTAVKKKLRLAIKELPKMLLYDMELNSLESEALGENKGIMVSNMNMGGKVITNVNSGRRSWVRVSNLNKLYSVD